MALAPRAGPDLFLHLLQPRLSDSGPGGACRHPAGAGLLATSKPAARRHALLVRSHAAMVRQWLTRLNDPLGCRSGCFYLTDRESVAACEPCDLLRGLLVIRGRGAGLRAVSIRRHAAGCGFSEPLPCASRASAAPRTGSTSLARRDFHAAVALASNL